jgi:hypothetical protein
VAAGFGRTKLSNKGHFLSNVGSPLIISGGVTPIFRTFQLRPKDFLFPLLSAFHLLQHSFESIRSLLGLTSL